MKAMELECDGYLPDRPRSISYKTISFVIRVNGATIRGSIACAENVLSANAYRQPQKSRPNCGGDIILILKRNERKQVGFVFNLSRTLQFEKIYFNKHVAPRISRVTKCPKKYPLSAPALQR